MFLIEPKQSRESSMTRATSLDGITSNITRKVLYRKKVRNLAKHMI